MYAKSIVSAVALAGTASAYVPLVARQAPSNGTIITTTTVVDVLPTWCPDDLNTVIHGDKTWTVEGPTWFTITDCPCTSTYVCCPRLLTAMQSAVREHL